MLSEDTEKVSKVENLDCIGEIRTIGVHLYEQRFGIFLSKKAWNNISNYL